MSFAICSLVAASTVTADAQQAEPAKRGGFGELSAIGKVVGPTSKPEPGVPVEITGPPGKIHALTDQNGQWHVYNLPAGEYNVQPLKASKSVASFTVDHKTLLQRWFGGAEPPKVAAEIKIE